MEFILKSFYKFRKCKYYRKFYYQICIVSNYNKSYYNDYFYFWDKFQFKAGKVDNYINYIARKNPRNLE